MHMPKHSDEAKQYFRALVPELPSVEVRPMFGAVAAFVNGNMFAGVHETRFLMRLSPEDRERLLVEEHHRPEGLVVLGAVFGAFLLLTINRALPVLGIPDFWQRAVVGALIIGAIILDRVLAVRQARRLQQERSAV